MMTAASSTQAATFGNPDQPSQGAINTEGNPSSTTVIGPNNPALSGQFPAALSPPATDVGSLPMFWASFNNAPRRIQNGGWARQVTQADFQISEEIAGVNMRLTRGGVREMHWHVFAEWAFVTKGVCRITTIDQDGRANVEDVREGGLWYFPAGLPHSLQGIGEDGCEFIICFDNGQASEYDTLLVTQWLAHTQPETLALNFGVSVDDFKNIPLHDLYIFQSSLPGPLEQDQKDARGNAGAPKLRSSFALGDMAPVKKTKGGEVRIADSSNFPVSTTIASALVRIHPGGMREMHWHPNADEWLYIIEGEGELTVFETGPKAVTQNFNAGDIGYVKRSQGHFLRNTGHTDIVYLEVFRSSYFSDVSLSDWITRTPRAMVRQTLNVSDETIDRFPVGKPVILPL
jgi:oxalate decarboxylase